MSKRRGKRHPYTGPVTRQQIQAKQQEKELREAQQGIIDYSDREIADEIESEFSRFPKDGELEPGSEEVPLPVKEEKPRRWYVLDTNLILSCVDIIYDEDDEDWCPPLNFKPKLTDADLIIPQVVFDELNHIKAETTLRGMIARIAFDRLCKLIPNSGRSFDDIMHLRAPIKTGLDSQTISILPIHKNFHKILPWVPDRDDNDGWIAVTALAATMIRRGLPVDGSEVTSDNEGANIMMRNNEQKDVVLLTNDKALLSKADEYGVRVKQYSFKKRPDFTGMRELIVPPKMFEKFYHEEKLTDVDFKYYLPDEPPLIANEYLIMEPEDDVYPAGYFSHDEPFINVARYHGENGLITPLRFMGHEGKNAPNTGIAAYFDALNDDSIKIINVTGAAGTGKTFNAITHAIKELKSGRYSRIITIPSQPAKNPLGALPGKQEQKMEPLVAACKDAIEAYLSEKPEFKKKRDTLRKFGDRESGYEEEEIADERRIKKRSEHSNRDFGRTRGAYTGNFLDLDYGTNDYSPEDFGEPHSKKKKEKAFYPGKGDKKSAESGGEKMTYQDFLKKQVDYIYNRYFESYPYEQVQGRSFQDAIIILDEAQRIQIDDADTLISRPGKGSKIIVLGDINQIHDSSPEKQFKNGLNYSQMLFFDWTGCANIHLTENMRSDIARVMTKNRRKVRRRMGQI